MNAVGEGGRKAALLPRRDRPLRHQPLHERPRRFEPLARPRATALRRDRSSRRAGTARTPAAARGHAPARRRRAPLRAPARGWCASCRGAARRRGTRRAPACRLPRVDEQRAIGALDVERVLDLQLIVFDRRSPRASPPRRCAPAAAARGRRRRAPRCPSRRRRAAPQPPLRARLTSAPSASTRSTSSGICPSACVAHERHGS